MAKHETFADIRKETEARFRELVEAWMQRRSAFQTTVGAMQAFNNVFDRLEAAHKREMDEMFDVLVRIGNWCAQDLAENAYVSDSSGNYLKTLNGLCEVCRSFMRKASKLKKYGGANG